MKRVGYILIVVSMLWLAACAPTPTEAPTEAPAAPAAETKTMVIGFTSSQTGKLEVSAGRQAKGLELWMNEVNEAGGITLGDGTVVKFSFATYDDESSKDRVQELYTRLATEDNADLLISPYSSGLTSATLDEPAFTRPSTTAIRLGMTSSGKESSLASSIS